MTGNGGPPSPSQFSSFQNWSYTHSTTDINADPNVFGSYTIMEAVNHREMKWTQISNGDGSVLDELVIVQLSHGEFPLPNVSSS